MAHVPRNDKMKKIQMVDLKSQYDKIKDDTEKVRVEMNEKVRYNRYFKESLTKEEKQRLFEASQNK